MKHQSSRSIVVALVAWLIAPVAAGAQDYKGKAKVEGKIVNAEGAGMKDAVVTAVFADTGTGPKAIEAKGNGEFEVKDLKPGKWTLTAHAGHLGYGAETVEVDVAERDNPELTITLQPLQALLDQANAAFQAKRLDEALDLFLKIHTALPDNLALHQPIALAYQGVGKHAEAIEHFDLVLEALDRADPGVAMLPPGSGAMIRVQAVSSLAAMDDFARMHDYINAIPADQFDQRTVDGLLEVAANSLMNEKKNYAEAVKLLDPLIQRAPSAPLPYYYRGMANVQLENDEAAIADLKKAVELSPTETPQVRQAKEVIEKLSAAPSSN